MSRMPTRLVIAVAAAAVALAGCTSSPKSGPASSPNATPSSTANGTTSGAPNGTASTPKGAASSTKRTAAGKQTTVPAPSVSRVGTVKAAYTDVKLGALSVDPKLGTPTAMITITNHSSTRSNYIVDLSITSASGKVQLDASMVAAPGLAPGHTARRAAKFMTTKKLPAGAKLRIVGVARLAA